MLYIGVFHEIGCVSLSNESNGKNSSKIKKLPKLKTAPLATLFGSGMTSVVRTNKEDQTEWMELPTKT